MKNTVQFHIHADHPAFAGHFPGTPIVPGVVLLDEALHVITIHTATRADQWQISSAKFLSPVKPDETLVIEYELQTNGAVTFTIVESTSQGAGRLIASGNLAPVQP